MYWFSIGIVCVLRAKGQQPMVLPYGTDGDPFRIELPIPSQLRGLLARHL